MMTVNVQGSRRVCRSGGLRLHSPRSHFNGESAEGFVLDAASAIDPGFSHDFHAPLNRLEGMRAAGYDLEHMKSNKSIS